MIVEGNGVRNHFSGAHCSAWCFSIRIAQRPSSARAPNPTAGFSLSQSGSEKIFIMRSFSEPRVAHTLICIYAPHEPGQHPCPRVPSVACSGFRSTGTPACALCMECISQGTGRSACVTHNMIDYSRTFSDDCQPRYAVKILRVVGYERAAVFNGSGRNPSILGGDRLPPPHAANLAPSRAQLPV